MDISQQFNTGGNSLASRDLTNQTFSDHLAPVASKGGLNIAFSHVRVRLSTIEPEKNGKMETRLVVFKQPKGDRYTVAARMITPEKAMADPELAHAYQMFVQYAEVPTTGTPLHELPGISQSQIGLLTINGLRSIEDLVETPDELINQMGLEVMAAKKIAIRWTKQKGDAAETIETAELEAKHEVERKALSERLAALERRNAELEAENKALGKIQVQSGGDQVHSVHMPGVSASGSGTVEVESDVPDIDPDDGFMSGGDITADGNADLNDGDVDPLG
ncbi:MULTISPECIES: hypothetical protein [Halocynthiibacter]|uniref:Uncharacterized protein n=1 Tax=Halocynthiibacter halioticoli TaxID=2986804 RepID=A0AAE3LUV3_9RHOB|nr:MULTISPECIES: hypothetical protein [Halocynthiibacter]MCV6826005.1 hypothetical protein [Halocynthiibacter halioticoli]MCW4059006.1 hypothetical protein [Halocynthiibacter sp. SDUM655004]